MICFKHGYFKTLDYLRGELFPNVNENDVFIYQIEKQRCCLRTNKAFHLETDVTNIHEYKKFELHYCILNFVSSISLKLCFSKYLKW